MFNELAGRYQRRRSRVEMAKEGASGEGREKTCSLVKNVDIELVHSSHGFLGHPPRQNLDQNDCLATARLCPVPTGGRGGGS